ncbi:MAG: HAD family hydrolase [Candidatus Taylorbacteria bacterium]|nr:HAD family hydrolase [Candidatus Taylorbacteria bacterium]
MKNIIFDWSGVVKDAVTTQCWIINKIFNRHGLQTLSVEEFKNNWEQPYWLFYNKYLPNISLEKENRDYMEAILSVDCPKSQSCPGVVELIKSLKNKGVFLAVVSSDHPETILDEIKEYGLENVFAEVITKVHDKFDSVNDLVKKYNLPLIETYFVGDSNHEIDVAKRIGIKSVAVT